MINNNEMRKIMVSISLSDTDVRELVHLCGAYGITVNDLFENFANDLIAGDRSNGSDERLFARQYFDRCNMFPEKTLMRWIVEESPYELEKFIDLADERERLRSELMERQQNEDDYDYEETEDIREDYEGLDERLIGIVNEYCEYNPEMGDDLYGEVRELQKWYHEQENFLNGK